MIVVDTEPLVALVNSSDSDHRRCVEWIETADEPLLVPNTVLTEACYLLQRRCGSKIEARFLSRRPHPATIAVALSLSMARVRREVPLR